MTDKTAQAGAAAPRAQKLVVPFTPEALAAFALAAQKGQGHVELTDSGELSIRFPDGRIVIFTGSQEHPELLTPEALAAFAEDPAAIVRAARGLVAQDNADHSASGTSSAHLSTGMGEEITPPPETEESVPVGEDIPYLSELDSTRYSFALDLDRLFRHYQDRAISTGVGDVRPHLPGQPDEDYFRGSDPRDEITGRVNEGEDTPPPARSSAMDDAFSGREDEPISGNVLANDITPNGHANLRIVSPPSVGGGLTMNPDGSFTWQPPADFSGRTTFTYAFDDPLTGQHHEQLVTLEVLPVTDAPLATAADAAGAEDAPIPLNGLSAALSDADASEAITVRITGVPAGASFSAGHDNGDGTWSFAPEELSGLVFTPPANGSGSYDMALVVTSREEASGETSTTTAPFTVTVEAVADAPSVTGGAFSTEEDTPVSLSGIGAQLTDADGSEAITSYTLSNVPAGVSFSAGTDNDNGTWSFTPDELANLTFTPPANWHGQLNLTLTATTTEIANGDAATASAPVTITVDAQADAPDVSGGASSGNEDTAIAFGDQISWTLNDDDGSESVTQVKIAGIPSGAHVAFSGPATVSGDDASGYVITGSEADIRATLDAAAITPPANSDEDFNLSISVTTTDADGSTATTTESHAITVTAVADAPSVTGGAFSTEEDTPVSLSGIGAQPTDTDGSEAVTGYVISNVPAGASFSAGTDNGDGTWSFDPGELANLSFTPPANWHGQLNLALTATSTETANGDAATASAAVTITVDAQADAPDVSGGASSGDEDTAIAFGDQIGWTLNDDDGSESVTEVKISGIPAGAHVAFSGPATVSGDDASGYVITGSEADIRATLDAAAITPAPDSDAEIALNVEVSVTDADGSTASASAVHSVTVAAVADAPVLSGAGAGDEDTAIAVPVSVALADGDGSESIDRVEISAPAGVVLGWDAASGASVTQNGQSWRFEGSDAQIQAALNSLTATPPANSDAEFSLHVTAWSIESNPTGGQVDTLTAQSDFDVPVTVAAVADAPVVNTGTTTANEDTPATFGNAITWTKPDDDGSEAVTEVKIAGIPDGAHVAFSGPATVSGDDANGYTIIGSEADIRATLDTAAITPPANSDEDFNLSISVTTTDADGSMATTTESHAITVEAVADAPSVTGGAFSTEEDTPLSLSGIGAQLTDADGSEAITSYTLSNVPTGASFSAGTDNDNGTWSFTPDELANLTFTPPANWHGQLNLTLTATSTETANGNAATASAPVTITVDAQADAPVVNTGTTPAQEDTRVTFGDAITWSKPDDDGSESVTEVKITGIPDGAKIGFSGPATVSGDDASGYVITGSEADIRATLDTAAITPPANSDEDFNLSISVTTTDADGSTATTTESHAITVTAVADAPVVSTRTTATREDMAATFGDAITWSKPDDDGSEAVTEVKIAGIPAGAHVELAPSGTAVVSGDDSSGYVITGPEADIRATLDTAAITPAPDSDADFNLSVTVTTTDHDGSTASTTESHAITVEAVADAPSVTGGAFSTEEDTPLSLSGIGAQLTDTDGSETITSYTLSNVPTGASFSAGTNNGNGTWSFTPDELANLTFIPPANWHGQLNLTLTATSTETANGDAATASAPVTITVDAQADAPDVSGSSVGDEDAAIAFGADITIAKVDRDGSESITRVKIGDIPQDAHVALTASGSAAVSGDDASGYVITGLEADILNTLAGATITPPANSDADINISIDVTTTDADGSEATTSHVQSVLVRAVADTPSVTGGDYTTDEDVRVELAGIGGALADGDGSETLVFQLSDVPAGASFQNATGDAIGTDFGNGAWQFSPAEISGGVYFVPPAQADGDYAMTMTALATEGASGAQVAVKTATATAAINVHVDPVLDAPVLNSGSSAVNEDQLIHLGADIDLSLADTDGSQTMEITLSGIPAGATVNYGAAAGVTVSNPNPGEYVISGPAAGALSVLDSLTVRPAQHDDADFTVNITAQTTEANGDSATATGTQDVIVHAVADAPDLEPLTDARGDEDTAIAVPVNVALVDGDGSEKLDHVDITGVPSGATLAWDTSLPGTVTAISGGYRFEGSESEIQDLLASLTLTPPANSGDDITLTATAVSVEANPTEAGDVAVSTAQTVTPIPVDVVPVADQPSVDVGAGAFSGEEDTWIALSGFGGALVDGDGSETLTYRITGAPSDASFSAGHRNSDGSWSFPKAEIDAGISFRAALNKHGEWTMTLESIATEGENGDAATNSADFTVTVDAQADAPLISGSSVTDEDTTIQFGQNISVSLYDADGSESITSISLTMPSGLTPTYTARDGASVEVSGDVYTITGPRADIQATLDTFALTPPANDDTDIAIQVSAKTEDADGSTNSRDATHVIVVRAVADAPTAAAGDVSGTEDEWFALSGLQAGASVDTDGSETISAVVTNIPAGTEVRVNGVAGASVVRDGSNWVITAPDLDTLNDALAAAEMKMPKDFSGDWTATLRVYSTEAALGSQVSVAQAEAGADFQVSITAVAETPDIVVTPSVAGAAGLEDTPIPLSINLTNVDVDGSEDVSIIIGNVPDGASLSAGVDNGDGTWTLTLDDLSGLSITPPHDSNEDFQLSVSVTMTENVPGNPGDGDSQTSTATLDVQVLGVADAPTVTVNPVSSPEDQPIPLGQAISAQLTDTDGSETLSYVITGLPAGVTPSVGAYIGNNSWQVTADELPGLTIPAPANFSGDYVAEIAPALRIRAVSQENDGDQTYTEATPQITITPVVDPVSNGAGTTALEDEGISLAGMAVTAFGDSDGSEHVVSYTIDFSNIVADAQIAGTVADAADFIANHVNGTFTDNGDGTITVAAADIGSISLDAAAFADSNEDFSLPVSILVEDAGAGESVSASFEKTFAINLVGVADTPTVFAQSVSGSSGAVLDLNPTDSEFGGQSMDSDAQLGRNASEEIYYIVSGVDSEPGVRLAFVDVTTGVPVGLNNNDGTWLLRPADLANLGVKTSAGSDGTVQLTLTTVAVENDGDRATSSTTFEVSVTPGSGGGSDVDPLPPVVNIEAMNTNEDGSVTFAVTAEPDPDDPSPNPPAVNVVIRGIPEGAQVSGATYNPLNDTWLADADTVNAGNVSIIPPKDFSGTMNITVEAVATNEDLNSASSGLIDAPVEVAPVADGPAISLTSLGGGEDTAIPLDISLALRDLNGTQNEVIDDTVTITLDNGAALSAGTDNGDGTWTLSLADLDGLMLIPAENLHGVVHVGVSASTTEPANGDRASSTASITVNVDPVADAPSITVADASGNEDVPISLSGLSAALNDTDGSEVLSVKISGVPEDAILSAGTNNGDGTWTITPADLADLAITMPRNYSGDCTLTLHAYALDANGDTAETAQDFHVVVNPVADPLLMTLLPKSGSEGTLINLDMNLKLGDDNGATPGENPPETAEITFSGVPEGVIFRATAGGTLVNNHDGTWSFSGTAEQANGLAVLSTGPDGEVTIGVSARASDSGATGDATTGSITITFDAVEGQSLIGTAESNTLVGDAGDDTISALAGNDYLNGGSGYDTLYAGAGNDHLYGGLGADILSGGSGADTFAYADGDADGPADTITDFSTAEGDVLDIADLLQGYDPATSALTDYVNLVESNGDTIVRLDPQGNGNFTVQVATLSGVTGLDAGTMEADGNLVTQHLYF